MHFEYCFKIAAIDFSLINFNVRIISSLLNLPYFFLQGCHYPSHSVLCFSEKSWFLSVSALELFEHAPFCSHLALQNLLRGWAYPLTLLLNKPLEAASLLSGLKLTSKYYEWTVRKAVAALSASLLFFPLLHSSFPSFLSSLISIKKQTFTKSS